MKPWEQRHPCDYCGTMLDEDDCVESDIPAVNGPTLHSATQCREYSRGRGDPAVVADDRREGNAECLGLGRVGGCAYRTHETVAKFFDLADDG